MTADIDRYVDDLRHTITVAALNYEIWWVYTSKDTRPTYVEVMNRYPLFFQTAVHAHFGALLIALYRLYETRNDTISIPSLLKMLRVEERLPADRLDSLECMYRDKAKPLWRKVSILRNKAFGHRSAEHLTNEVFREAKVCPNELRDLVDATKRLLNELTYGRDRSRDAFNLHSRTDTLQLLDDLKGMYGR